MTDGRTVGAAAVALLALLAGCTPGEALLEVRDAWSRPTIAADAPADAPGPQAPGVVYLVVENRGGKADRLLSATSDACETIEIHETRLDGDRMRMVPVEGGLEVPARGRAELSPGGYHMMLIDLRRHLRPGDRFDVELEFETSGSIAVPVEVRRI